MGSLLPWDPLAQGLADSNVVMVLAVANPGVIPPKASQERAQPYAESHTPAG